MGASVCLALIGERFERGFVRNDQLPAIYNDQSLMLKTRESARHDLAHRADTRRNLLVGLSQVHASSSFGPGAFPARFRYEKARQPLPNFTE